MKQRKWIVTAIILIAAVNLPFIYAALVKQSGSIFGGFLLNPLDGYSYLAKMRLGLEGGWRFVLPFTADPGSGAYLFLFYIALGHIARLLGGNLLLTFHLARLGCSILLLVSISRFCRRFLNSFAEPVQFAGFFLIIAGSGLGWLAVLLGLFTSDLWLAEAFPFLSMFSNPHFPLGLALLLEYFLALENKGYRSRPGWVVLIGLALSIIFPFGMVIAGVVTLLLAAQDFLGHKALNLRAPVYFFSLGGPFLLYQFIATIRDPQLSVWNRQNLTISPAIWDTLLSFSPALLLAGYGIYRAARKHEFEEIRLPVTWAISSLVVMYLPFALQRRMALGLQIPLGLLAAVGLVYLVREKAGEFRRAALLVGGVSIMTNLVFLAGVLSVISRALSPVYYPQADQPAFDWMVTQTGKISAPALAPVILAAPDTGALIPAITGWRVVYGHPFETVDAAQEKADVIRYFSNQMDPAEQKAFLSANQVEYIFYGPAEKALDGGNLFSGQSVVFQQGDVAIYQAGGG